MAVYRCTICETVFDEGKESRQWDQLDDDWTCIVCASGKAMWQPMDAEEAQQAPPDAAAASGAALDAIPEKPSDEFETTMADIRTMAATGASIIEPMSTRQP